MISTQFSIRPNDSMAGNNVGDRVGANGCAHSSIGIGIVEVVAYMAISGELPHRNFE